MYTINDNKGRTLTITTIATLAVGAVLVLTACGIRAASERRAAYLEAEAAYYECIESTLTHAECVAGVFGESAAANNYFKICYKVNIN